MVAKQFLQFSDQEIEDTINVGYFLLKYVSMTVIPRAVFLYRIIPIYLTKIKKTENVNSCYESA